MFIFANRVSVNLMIEQRGASNTQAKRELGWRLAHGLWRDRFIALLTNWGLKALRDVVAPSRSREP